jgi:hypothetical protein
MVKESIKLISKLAVFDNLTVSLVASQIEHFRTSGILDAEGAAEDPSQDVSQDMMMANVFRWLYTSGKTFDP